MMEETIQTTLMHRNSLTSVVLFRTFSLNVAKHVNRLHHIVGNYLQNILPPKQFMPFCCRAAINIHYIFCFNKHILHFTIVVRLPFPHSQ